MPVRQTIMVLQVLQIFSWGQTLGASLVAVAALLGAAVPGLGQASAGTWSSLAAAALLAAAFSWQCGMMRQKFIFVDYVHADT